MYLTLQTINELEKAKKENKKEITLSLDLGLTKKTISVDNLSSIISNCPKIRNEDIVFYDENKKMGFKLQIANENGICSLRKDFKESKPVLYINAVKMNVSKDFGIDGYNENVIKNLQLKKTDFVLEICTGAGYKTILLVEKAKKVISVEKSEDVLELMKYNPYTKDLQNKTNLEIINIDAIKFVRNTKEKFDKILHDPPTYKFAPELYTEKFYKDLFLISENGCIFFHYTGNPGNKFRGTDIIKATVERAISAGWKLIKKEDLGIYFRK